MAKAAPPAEVKHASGPKSRNDNEQEAAIKRRHSFDSTVDYKPGRSAVLEKAHHDRFPVPPPRRDTHQLYGRPHTFVKKNAEIVFSLADIQPYAPNRGFPVAPRHDHRKPAVKAVDSRSSDRRHATIPRPFGYGHTARQQPRDNSITYDFDDFF